jgi:hypothetical protein
MLASVVGSHTSTAFDKLINNLPVDYATTRLCIKGLDMVLQRCYIKLAPGASLPIGKVKAANLSVCCDFEETESNGQLLKRVSLLWSDAATSSAAQFRINSTTKHASKLELSAESLPFGSKTTAFGILDYFSIVHPTTATEPDGVKKEDYYDRPISGLAGELSFAPNGIDFEVEWLKVTVNSPHSKSLMLLDSRKIRLEALAMKIAYDRGDSVASIGFEGVVRLLSGLDIPVTFSHTDKGELYQGNFHVESRSGKKPPSQNSQFDMIATTIISNADRIMRPPAAGVPASLPVMSGSASFMRGQSIDLSAVINATKWHLRFGKLNLKFHGVEGIIAANDSGAQKIWKAALLGEISFGPFVNVQAILQMCKSREPLLAARLSKSSEPGGNDDVSSLVQDVSLNGDYWEEVRPHEGPILSLDADARMYLNFDTSSILFTGSVYNVGGIAILAKRSAAQRGIEEKTHGFLVAIGLTDPATLWKKTAPKVSQYFDFESVTALFASVDWEAVDLERMVQDASSAAEELKAVPDKDQKFSPGAIAADEQVAPKLLTIPYGQTKISKGAGFRAVISLGGDKSMTTALRNSVESSNPPQMNIWAKISEADTEFGVSLTEVTLAGGAITLKNCLGTFIPNKKKPMETEVMATLSFSADLDFKIPDTNSLGGFKVNTEINSRQLDFKVALGRKKTKAQIPTPFGKTFDLTLNVVEFHGSIMFSKESDKKTSFNVHGNVTILNVDLDATLLFFAGRPKVLTISFSKPLIAEEITKGVIKNGEDWPTESLPPVSFDEGLIYYALMKDGEQPLTDPRNGKTLFFPGFNIQTVMTVFSRKAYVRAHLPQERTGLKIDGALEKPIDMGWLRLSQSDADGQDVNADKGPTFSLIWKTAVGASKTKEVNSCSDTVTK